MPAGSMAVTNFSSRPHLPNLPKRHHQPGTKYPNAWETMGEHSSTEPPQHTKIKQVKVPKLSMCMYVHICRCVYVHVYRYTCMWACVCGDQGSAKVGVPQDVSLNCPWTHDSTSACPILYYKQTPPCLGFMWVLGVKLQVLMLSTILQGLWGYS